MVVQCLGVRLHIISAQCQHFKFFYLLNKISCSRRCCWCGEIGVRCQ